MTRLHTLKHTIDCYNTPEAPVAGGRAAFPGAVKFPKAVVDCVQICQSTRGMASPPSSTASGHAASRAQATRASRPRPGANLPGHSKFKKLPHLPELQKNSVEFQNLLSLTCPLDFFGRRRLKARSDFTKMQMK